MNNHEVKKIVGDLPHMSIKQAEEIKKLIVDFKIENILELGFCHGVSTCYMAAALSELGRGSITTIDLEWAHEAKPNVEELLKRIGERERVNVFYEPTSYTWRLMRFLELDSTPRFDLCYLDGAHSWFVDGLAFFLVDRLLKPNGWIIFDDLDWTYASSPTLNKRKETQNMPVDEQTLPQVRKIYELLVKTNPNYYNFRTENNMAFTQKKDTNTITDVNHREILSEEIHSVERVHVGIGAIMIKIIKSFRKSRLNGIIQESF